MGLNWNTVTDFDDYPSELSDNTFKEFISWTKNMPIQMSQDKTNIYH